MFRLYPLILFIAIVLISGKHAKRDITGEEIIKNFIKKSGGKRKIAGHDNITLYLQIQIRNIKMKGTIFYKSPNKYCQALMFKNDTIQKHIYNGDTSYLVKTDTIKQLKDQSAAILRTQSYMFPELMYLEKNYSLDFEGLETINNKPAYKVRIKNHNNYTHFAWYQKKTGMKLRTRFPEGDTEKIIDIKRYKTIDDVRFPVIKKITAKDYEIIMKLRYVDFSEVNESHFRVNVPYGSQN